MGNDYKSRLTSEFSKTEKSGQNDPFVQTEDEEFDEINNFYENEYRRLLQENQRLESDLKRKIIEIRQLKKATEKFGQKSDGFLGQKGKGRKVKNIDMNIVLELKEKKYSLEQIAKLMNVSSKTIQRRLNATKNAL